MRYGLVWPTYAKQWDSMAINAGRASEFHDYAAYAIAHKDIYESIQTRTGVLWYHTAVLHRREADGDFGTYLGNGQSINRVTSLVPKGRGPFKSFADGAVDAERLDGLSSVLDWRLEKILYFCELFNGTGYYARGIPSPYLWGGTNIQRPGKFVADHEFSYTEMDQQPGCAPMLAAIANLDKTVHFVRET